MNGPSTPAREGRTGPSRRVALPALVLLLASCAPDRGDDYVDIDGLPLRTAIEAVRLGGPDAPPPELFARSPQVTVGPDGSLYVLVQEAYEVRRFGADGAHLATFGGRGEGPGELLAPLRIGFVADTLWIAEISPPRIQYLTADGDPVRTDAIENPVIGRTGIPQLPSALLRGGRSLEVAEVPFGEPAGRVEVPVLIRPLDPGAPPSTDTLGVIPVPASLRVPDVGTFSAVRRFPGPIFFDAPSGGAYVVVADTVGVARGALRIRRLAPDGAIDLARALPLPPVEVPDRVRDSIVAAGVEAVRRGAASRRELTGEAVALPEDLEAVIRTDLAIPDVYPPVRALLAGEDGSIWLNRMARPDDSLWIVIGADGAPLFRVTFPGGVQPLVVTRTSAWAITTDALGVPYLLRYTLSDQTPGG